MKKILLIIAIVACLAICGTALASVSYYNASNVNGSVTANQGIVLSLDGSSDINEIALAAGQPVVYTIQCDVEKSASVENTGTLTIQLSALSGEVSVGVPYNLNGVTVTLYSDSTCTTPVEGKTQTGAGTITVAEIEETTTYFAKVTFAGADTEAALTAVQGSMSINFVVAE